MTDPNLSDEAKALSRRGASRGGKARAERLSPEMRQEIARRGAEARWGKTVMRVTHPGTLRIGDRDLDCAVLEDGTRVLNQRKMLIALERTGGARRGAGARRAPFLSAANLQPFITAELRQMAEHPIVYRTETGGLAHGYNAEALVLICEAYLSAREERALTRNQLPVARAAEMLMRGLARIGIVALIDEATGYQEVRARFELQQILEAYVQAELRPWVKLFPNEFFEEVYRLKGWEYRPGTSKRTPYVGKLINKYVYEQLPPGVLDELQRINPRTPKGYRSHKHHQFLTADTGNPQLDKQISTVTTLMRISQNKSEFEMLFERAFPPLQPRLPFLVPLDDPSDD